MNRSVPGSIDELKKCGFSLFLLMAAAAAHADPAVGLAQGLLAGEMTENDVILQARLTTGGREENGEILGAEGIGRFEISPDPDFGTQIDSDWLGAAAEHDFILKARIDGLRPATVYYYRLRYGANRDDTTVSRPAQFRTLAGERISRPVTFTALTCLNYEKFHFGDFNKKGEMIKPPYPGRDKELGFPSFAFIPFLEPDFVIYNGDIVYYDQATPGKPIADDVQSMRYRWHRMLSQPRVLNTLARAGGYWLKDDHDFRYNDADNTGDTAPSPETGIRIFREQAPITDPDDPDAVTYRTHRVSKELQLWFLEGRDYRSPNAMEDGPGKTLWGKAQETWLKQTLLASNATFKVLITPNPLVGPDKANKTDNHTNIGGFRHEGGEFFDWLKDNGFASNELFIITGDRHWQYHSIHPSGYQEFSSGSISYANAQRVIAPGDPKGTDPDALIRQPFASPIKNGGFLQVDVIPAGERSEAGFKVRFYDEWGQLLYTFHATSGS
jgi:alkaline phosphatase D